MSFERYNEYLQKSPFKTKKARPRKNETLIKVQKERAQLLSQSIKDEKKASAEIIKMYGAEDIFERLEDLIKITKVVPDPMQCLQKLGWMWDLIASPQEIRYLALRRLSLMQQEIREASGKDPMDDPMPKFSDELDDLSFMQHSKRILMT